eukprot:CAMPEP_0197065768 /NCGR_PEP_ID=MMETSP1384-20130603/169217_1 /TAXON_ID=29189 /ORGANISM="Ammonia sp." /LENGTH=84 /DNA_ID=CAMNT_0042502725 /DNA_START=20 /DNA_END=270 /DNA_ORIENTATION=+
MDYPQPYSFQGSKITKGLQVSYGKKISSQRFSRVSDDAFTEQEVIEWKSKMNKDGTPLPTKSDLEGAAQTLGIMRECAEAMKET